MTVRSKQMAIVGAFVLAVGLFGLSRFGSSWQDAMSTARLVSVQEFPDGDSCDRPAGLAASPDQSLFSAFQETSVYAQDAKTQEVNRPPLRFLRDRDPIYSYAGLDPRRDEVVMLDSNLWSIRFFNRLENTPPGAVRSEPKRIISGDKTVLAFNSCMYIDPKNGDIYTVEDDVGNMVEVFSDSSEGDVAPLRKLVV